MELVQTFLDETREISWSGVLEFIQIREKCCLQALRRV